jgi:hypothetical protein
MGRRKTTVEKTTERRTESQLVKFTYLQSLAVANGLTSAGAVGGETGPSSETTTTNSSNPPGVIQKYYDKWLSKDTRKLTDKLPKGGGLFKKKTNTTTKIDYKETGWTLVKTWNQPEFDIIRYAIGIKELIVAQFTYEETSEIISKPWTSPKEIVKVVLNVDQFIPSNFTVGNYIDYYIKPNVQDFDWIRINPLGTPSVFTEDGNVVPRIVNFNTEKPLSSRFEDAYFFTTPPVKEVIFRAVLRRPVTLDDGSSGEGYSPILRSYRLSLIPRNGL